MAMLRLQIQLRTQTNNCRKARRLTDPLASVLFDSLLAFIFVADASECSCSMVLALRRTSGGHDITHISTQKVASQN
jgi:hypothetical protein